MFYRYYYQKQQDHTAQTQAQWSRGRCRNNRNLPTWRHDMDTFLRHFEDDSAKRAKCMRRFKRLIVFATFTISIGSLFTLRGCSDPERVHYISQKVKCEDPTDYLLAIADHLIGTCIFLAWIALFSIPIGLAVLLVISSFVFLISLFNKIYPNATMRIAHLYRSRLVFCRIIWYRLFGHYKVHPDILRDSLTFLPQNDAKRLINTCSLFADTIQAQFRGAVAIEVDGLNKVM